jgi:O-antigen/teichoic acid export membrane protein
MFKKYPDIILKVKQISAHKFGNFVTTNTDQILIFVFISIESVAFFGNYQLIFGKLSSLTNTAFSGTGAGIGNLVAENNKPTIKRVFWEMMALRFFIAGIMCITLFYMVEPFIEIWLGEKYILDKNVLYLFLMNLFIFQIRVPVDHFKDAYGLFSDTWAPIIQSLINLGVSLYFVNSLGMVGILLGTFISFSLIILIWRPYYLFKYGFEKKIWGYWIEFCKLILAFSLSAFLTDLIIGNFLFDNELGFFGLLIFGLEVISVSILLYSTILFILSTGFRNICNRVWRIFNIKK